MIAVIIISAPQSKNAVCDILVIFGFLHEKIPWSMFFQMVNTIFRKYF